MNHVPNTAADYHRTVTSLICQPLLSGINVPQHLARDVESHVWLTSKLRSFMVAREATLVERLSTLHWRVDGEAEIAAVLGDVPFPQVRNFLSQELESFGNNCPLAPPAFPLPPYQALR